jgi:Raf kinase inhibitor-like YbhB/YbcL family protein
LGQIKMSLTLTAPSFENQGHIPSQYTCDADNISPEIRIEGVPQGTRSFVLVMDDPDIPTEVKERLGIEKFDHWTLYNIPPDTNRIPEGESRGSLGLTSRGEAKYAGPCPPDREHRYFFRLYALNDTLHFDIPPTLDEVEKAAQKSMIESAMLIGRYERTSTN